MKFLNMNNNYTQLDKNGKLKTGRLCCCPKQTDVPGPIHDAECVKSVYGSQGIVLRESGTW